MFGGHFGVSGGVGAARGVLWANRDSRYSGQKGIGVSRGIQGSCSVELLGGVKGDRGVFGGWQGL